MRKRSTVKTPARNRKMDKRAYNTPDKASLLHSNSPQSNDATGQNQTQKLHLMPPKLVTPQKQHVSIDQPYGGADATHSDCSSHPHGEPVDAPLVTNNCDDASTAAVEEDGANSNSSHLWSLNHDTDALYCTPKRLRIDSLDTTVATTLTPPPLLFVGGVQDPLGGGQWVPAERPPVCRSLFAADTNDGDDMNEFLSTLEQQMWDNFASRWGVLSNDFASETGQV